jgi:hypothetical protein
VQPAAAVETKRRELRLAERQAVLAQLEAQIGSLAALDTKVAGAVRVLNEATAGLFSAIDAVAAALGTLNPGRYDGNYAYKLHAGLRDEILRSVMEFDRTVIEPGSLVGPVKVKLRQALAQLSFEAMEGQVTVAPGERLYKTRGRIGIRSVDLPDGSLIALRDDEVAAFEREAGKGWLVEEEPATQKSV